MSEGVTLPGLGSVNFEDLGKQYTKWMSAQHPAVEILVTGLQSAVQGGFLGYLIGSIGNMDPGKDASQAASLKAISTGTPIQQARNIAALTGTNAALALAIKKARGGVDDVWGAMGASFGSGVMFALVSGMPNPGQSALSTGAAFALFNGLFYQIGKAFQPQPDDGRYDMAKYLLKTLNLSKYEENLKRCELSDETLLLWNDSALQEAKIPPGPRLLLLNYIKHSASSALKPAMPAPGYPGYQTLPVQPWQTMPMQHAAPVGTGH